MKEGTGAQGAPCPSRLLPHLRRVLQLHLETRAQAALHEAQGAQDTLTKEEKVSLDCMLDENYGKPWCVSALDFQLHPQASADHVNLVIADLGTTVSAISV